MGVFTGTHTNKVDKKGRVSVPKTFRALFEREVLSGCLRLPVVPSARPRSLPRELSWSESSTASKTCRCSLTNRTTSRSSLKALSAWPSTPEGRVVIPDGFRDAAGIGTEIAFVGRGRTFQLWAPKAYASARKPAFERAKTRGLTLKLRRPSDRNTDGAEG